MNQHLRPTSNINKAIQFQLRNVGRRELLDVPYPVTLPKIILLQNSIVGASKLSIETLEAICNAKKSGLSVEKTILQPILAERKLIEEEGMDEEPDRPFIAQQSSVPQSIFDIPVPPTNMDDLTLCITQQPATKVIYRRSICPAPKVSLMGLNNATVDYFVIVELVELDHPDITLSSVMAAQTEKINYPGGTVTFHGLKILSTSSASKMLFQMKFHLCIMTDTSIEKIPGKFVLSDSIESFGKSNLMLAAEIREKVLS